MGVGQGCWIAEPMVEGPSFLTDDGGDVVRQPRLPRKPPWKLLPWKLPRKEDWDPFPLCVRKFEDKFDGSNRSLEAVSV